MPADDSGFQNLKPGPFLRPYLRAMARMQEGETLRPEQLVRRATEVLSETYGEAEGPVETAFAPGCVGLVSEHTYYFDGFALLLPLPFGTAVAVRPATPETACVVFEATREVVALADTAAEHAASRGAPPSDAAKRAVKLLQAALPHHAPPAIQMAVVSTIPDACEDGAVASLAVAAVQASQAVSGSKADAAAWMKPVGRAFAEILERPYGVAPLLGVCFGRLGQALVVDTATLEHLRLDLPARERLAWGLIDTKQAAPLDAAVFGRRQAQAAEALFRLKASGFPELTSLLVLEHKDLQAALAGLPRRLHPVTRYLVTENMRVQRISVALRQADSQLLGGLLLMSQGSLEEDWKEQNPAVKVIRAMGEDGESLYGARRVGREFGRAVLVVGQPLALSQFMDNVAMKLQEQFGAAPDTYLI